MKGLSSFEHKKDQLQHQFLDGPIFPKSIYPLSTSTDISSTRILSPTSTPSNPWTSLPSTGVLTSRTHVPLEEAPVTILSNCSPILDSRRSAAADFPTCRSTFLAASSVSVQCFARTSSSSFVYGEGFCSMAAFNKRFPQEIRHG